MRFLLTFFACLPAVCFAADFSGLWTKDLRTKAEIRNRAECGSAFFDLRQTGDQITGSHGLTTVGCGRQNEGGDGTVRGVVDGNIALLTVTSGRNGAVAIGKAKRKGNLLYWQYLEEIKPGEPDGDSALILRTATLKLERKP